MKTTFELSIIQTSIKPCSEKRENMLPHQMGSFCKSCKKVVHDLENLNTDQIALFTQKNEGRSICARVNSEVLNKPISLIYKKPEKYSYNFLFTTTLFIIFGTTLFSCDEKEHLIIRSKIENTFFENIGETRSTDEIFQSKKLNNSLPELKAEQFPDTIFGERDSTPIALDTLVISRSQFNYDIQGEFMSIHKYYSVTIDTSAIAPFEKFVAKSYPLLVYPNPARTDVNINFTIQEHGIALLTLFNINGQKIADIYSVFDAEPGKYEEHLNVSELASGTYILLLINGDTKEVFKLQVTH